MASLVEKGFGVTAEGFNRPNLVDLLGRASELFSETDAFGSDFDFKVDTALYQISSVFLAVLAEKLEIDEQNFNNSTPLKAEGVPLYQKGSFVGITRKQASYAETQVKITGSVGTQIPSGQQVKTLGGIVFAVVDGGTIIGTDITLNVKAQEPGSDGNVAKDTIVELVTPVIGVTSITNPTAATKGQEKETEVEFRNRYFDKLSQGTGNNVDGIASALKALAGVEDAIVYENNTSSTVDNVPPYSIAPLILGGDDNEIAKTVFGIKAGGAGESYGTTKVDITDEQGIKHPIGFSRPTEVASYVKIVLTKDSSYPADGDAKIKTAVVDYVNSLGINKNVYPYQITTTIANLSIQGIQNIVVTLSTDGSNYTGNPIVIGKNSIARTETDKVVIQ